MSELAAVSSDAVNSFGLQNGANAGVAYNASILSHIAGWAGQSEVC